MDIHISKIFIVIFYSINVIVITILCVKTVALLD